MGTHGWAYRRRQPEGTLLYEAVRENLATLLAEASEVGRGLPRYVERDFARYLEQALAARAAGEIEPLIGQTFDLADAAAAHTAIENRSALGKTLLTV